MTASEPSQFEQLVVTDKKVVLVVTFNRSTLVDAADVDAIGREFRRVLTRATELRRPILINMKGVQTICSALVGKLVLFAKQAKDGGLPFALCEVPPMLRAILNRFRGGDGDGGAGVLAMLDTPPKGDGGRAIPSATDRDEELE